MSGSSSSTRTLAEAREMYRTCPHGGRDTLAAALGQAGIPVRDEQSWWEIFWARRASRRGMSSEVRSWTLICRVQDHAYDRRRVERLQAALAAEARIGLDRTSLKLNRDADLGDPLTLLALKSAGGAVLVRAVRRHQRRARLLAQARYRDTGKAWLAWAAEFPLRERERKAFVEKVRDLRGERRAARYEAADQPSLPRRLSTWKSTHAHVARLLRAVGMPVQAVNHAKHVSLTEDERREVFRAVAGNLRGWKAYVVHRIWSPGAGKYSEDAGRYSSRCTWRKKSHTLEVCSWTVEKGLSVRVLYHTATCSDGRIFQWDGSAWVAQTGGAK